MSDLVVRSTRPDADREPPAHDHDAPHASRTPLMEFRDFCFAYDDEPVLSHIDLSIAIGDSAVLMGDNGSGKSTLLRAMNGLVIVGEAEIAEFHERYV